MNIEDLDKGLKDNGFELLMEVDNYYPRMVKSGINTYKSIYYNEKTKEIKALERKVVHANTNYEKELNLDDIRTLKDNHPIKVILNILESPDFKNSVINISKVKDNIKNLNDQPPIKIQLNINKLKV